MKERYDNLDSLRTISCLFLIVMHVCANANYSIPPLIHSFLALCTHFVLLFIMLSGFGMFCGYYERFKDGSISLNDFYKKRYMKLLPFFLTLIIIDLIMTRSISHIIEGITEATLVFGLLPNNQPDVIGVSWTLGVIFLFYLLFPFFVFLYWNKKRAFISFSLSILLSVFCCIYYFSDNFVIESFTARHNFLYCSPFFAAGALVYMYRVGIKKVVSKIRWLFLALCAVATAVSAYILDSNSDLDLVILICCLIVFIMWLMYAISVKSVIMNNKFMKYISGISMELYLSHMLVFRVLEKTKVLYLFGHGVVSLIVAWILVIIGLLVFINIWLFCRNKLTKMIFKKSET